MFGLQARIIALVVVIVAFVLALSTYLDTTLSARLFEDELRQQAIATAQRLAARMGARGNLEDAEAVRRELEETMAMRHGLERLEVFRSTAQGPALVASTADAPPMPVAPAAWSAVRAGQVVAHLERAQGLWDILAPIQWQGEMRGAVELRASLESARRLAALERRQSFAIVAAASALIAGGLAWYLQRHISRPIQALVTTMARAEAGDLTAEARLARRDELGQLAASLNRMLQRIAASYEENVRLLARVEQFNAELQAEVARATQELAARHEELRQTHARLFEMQRQLHRTEQLATAGQLAAMLAHDISTPLNAISGQAQLLLQRGDLDGEATERLKLIETQIAHVVEILQTLLTASAPAEPVFKPVEINALVDGLLALMAPVLSRHGIAVTTRLDPELPAVAGDAAQLQQVLLNGLVNALDAMPQGGTLRIETRRIAAAQPSPRQRSSPPTPGAAEPPLAVDLPAVQIVVADTGTGIPPEHLERIFEPFFTTKGIGKGSGLGLAICRRIVKAHGGSISIDSVLGAGTTLRIVLPAVKG
jgi:two-component system NtrC family sensor kinase